MLIKAIIQELAEKTNGTIGGQNMGQTMAKIFNYTKPIYSSTKHKRPNSHTIRHTRFIATGHTDEYIIIQKDSNPKTQQDVYLSDPNLFTTLIEFFS